MDNTDPGQQKFEGGRMGSDDLKNSFFKDDKNLNTKTEQDFTNKE